MLIKFKSADYLFYPQALALRNKVLREPLGLSLSDAELAIEKENDFYGVVIAGQVIGTLSFYASQATVATLTAFAIAPDFQGKGYGLSLLNFLIADLRQQGYTSIRVSARATALNFYQRAGFKASGERLTNPMVEEADYLMTFLL